MPLINPNAVSPQPRYRWIHPRSDRSCMRAKFGLYVSATINESIATTVCTKNVMQYTRDQREEVYCRSQRARGNVRRGRQRQIFLAARRSCPDDCRWRTRHQIQCEQHVDERMTYMKPVDRRIPAINVEITIKSSAMRGSRPSPKPSITRRCSFSLRSSLKMGVFTWCSY